VLYTNVRQSIYGDIPLKYIALMLVLFLSEGVAAGCLFDLYRGNYEEAVKSAASEIKRGNANRENFQCLGLAYYEYGYFSEAVQAFEKVLEFSHTDKQLSEAYQDLGKSLKYTGAFDQAISYLEKKILIDKKSNNRGEIGIALATIASILGDMNEDEESIKKSLESIKYLEHDGDRSSTYNNVAISYLSLGDLKNAFKYIDKAIEIDRKLFGDKKDLAIHLINKADFLSRYGKHTEALEPLNEGIGLIEKDGDKYWIMMGLINRGLVYEASSKSNLALNDYQRAKKLAADIKARELAYLEEAINRIQNSMPNNSMQPTANASAD